MIRGPDFWAYFQDDQELISHDDVHPTGRGYAASRRQWADQMVAAVYTAPASAGESASSLRASASAAPGHAGHREVRLDQ